MYSCQIQDDFLQEMVFPFSIPYSYYNMPSFVYFTKIRFLYIKSSVPMFDFLFCFGVWEEEKNTSLKIFHVQLLRFYSFSGT